MIVLGLDLETTGLNAADCEIIEVGAVLWDWDRQVPVRMMSELVQCPHEIPNEIVELTGIQNSDLQRWGVPLADALRKLHSMAAGAKYLVAHNGVQFDRLFLQKAWSKFPETQIDLPWIDTTCDLPIPKEIQTRKLSYLAAEMGFLNPFAHRSLFDVLTMLKVMSRFEQEEILKLQASPLKRIVAQVSYEEKDLAKAQGFRWDAQKRYWYLEGKECVLSGKQFPFPTQVL
jgi:DNA polymerase III alpha subunit (gram-positive type)